MREREGEQSRSERWKIKGLTGVLHGCGRGVDNKVC